MIKRTAYEDRNSHGRIDALAKVLGYTWDEESRSYFKNGVASTAPEASILKRIRPKKYHKGIPIPAEIYAQVMRLGHGESLDVSEVARMVNSDKQKMYNRFYSHAYNVGKASSHKFKVTERFGRLVVTRV